MKTEHLYQHFRPQEQFFVEKMTDLADRVIANYCLEVTTFLDPRQIFIAKSILGQYDLKIFSSCDYYPTEYAKLIVAPTYYQFDQSDFNISLVEINYNAKFSKLRHSQILGALLNQLGIKRHLIGDILVSEGCAQVFVDKSMVSYLIENTSKIARAGVSLKEVSMTQMMTQEFDIRRQLVLVSSWRLDKLVSEVLNLSRSKSISLIESEKVKLNYATSLKPSETLQIGDMISVRGFGRFKIAENQGLTKHSKHKLIIEKMLHK